jgi:hypothetical protein
MERKFLIYSYIVLPSLVSSREFINHFPSPLHTSLIFTNYTRHKTGNVVLVNAHAKHVAVIAVLKRFSSTRTRRSWLWRLDRNLCYGSAFPVETLESVAVGAITLHTQWLVSVHSEKLIYMWQRPLDCPITRRSTLANIDFLMVLSANGREKLLLMCRH